MKTKQLILLLIALLINTSAWGEVVASGTCGKYGSDIVNWELNSNNILRVYGTGNMADNSSASQPWYQYKDQIHSVVIDNGVTSIGQRAFEGFTSLESISIAPSVNQIGASAFKGSGLKSLLINPNCDWINIYGSAFANCESLSSIDLGDNVTILGIDAFYNTDFLNKQNFEGGVKYIGKYAVKYDNSTANIVVKEGTLLLADYSFFYDVSALKSVVLPSSIKTIGQYAFYKCNQLVQANIPSSTKNILRSAFSYTALTSVSIPESVTQIQEFAFANNSHLKEVRFEDGTANLKIATNVFNDGTPSGIFSDDRYIERVYVGRNLYYETSGAYGPFVVGGGTSLSRSSYYISQIEIGANVTNVPAKLFQDAPNITSVHINSNTPPSLTSSAFLSDVYENATLYVPAGYKSTYMSASSWNSFVNIEEMAPTTFELKYLVDGEEYHVDTYAVGASITPIAEPTKDGYTFSGWSTIPTTMPGEDVIVTGTFVRNTITLNQTSLTLNIGETSTLAATITPDNVVNKTIIWASSNESVANVDENGIVTAVAKGTATVTANTSDGHCVVGECKVNVVSIIASGTCGASGDNLTWTLDDEGHLVISGTGSMALYYTPEYVPWFNNHESIKKITLGNEVKSIGMYAFCGCSSLTSVGDLSACTSIGESAFKGCSSLTTVGDMSACKSIGQEVFKNCSSLTIVGDLSACTRIGGEAFSGCSSLTTIGDLPACTCIEGYAFFNCSSLTMVGDLSSCTNIGRLAFCQCKKLTNIGNLSSCTNIEVEAFDYCSSLTSIGNLSACKIIGDWAFRDCSSLTSIGDLSTCTSIGDRAFRNCSSLTMLGDLSACVSIGSYAFDNCSSLTSVGDMSVCTSIGTYAFNGCSLLEYIHTNDIASWCQGGSKRDLLTHGKSKKKLFVNGVECTNLVIPDGIENICDYAFYSFGNIKTVTLPNTIQNIGVSAFSHCSGLKNIDLPECIKSIGRFAFNGCDNLVNINIHALEAPYLDNANAFPTTTVISVPEGSINSYKNAENWDALYANNLIIEKTGYYQYVANVNSEQSMSTLHKNIGEENLKDVVDLTINGTINSYDLMILRNKMPSLRYLDLTDATIEANDYEYATGYHSEDYVLGKYALAQTGSATLKLASVKLPSNLKKIDEYALAGNTLLTGVTVPSSVSAIGAYAFDGCSAIPAIDLSETKITNIPSYTFRNCSALEVVRLPHSLSSINSYTFYNCKKLNTVVIPASVASIASNAFGNTTSTYACTGLKTITFADGSQLQAIASNAFVNCSSLQNFTLPAGVTTIGDNAFKACTSLTDVTLSPGITTVGNSMFEGCNKLESVSMPATVKKIGNKAFYGCSSLAEFQIPESVESIGTEAFNGCSSLNDVYSYTIEPTQINENTFSTWATATLHVPEQAYYTYYYNTQWKKFLNLSTVPKDYAYFYVNNDLILDQSTGSLGEGPDAQLNPGSGVIVKDEVEQGLGDVTVNADDPNASGAKYPSFIADGTVTVKDGKHLYINIEVTANKWYYFCFPFDIDIAKVKKTGNWVFREYDGAERAQGNSGWTHLNNGNSLLAGKGYIFQTNSGGTLTFEIATPDLNGHDVATVILEHAVTGSGSATDGGWNFIGNPFTAYYDLDALDYDCPITFWNGTTYETIRKGDDNYAFHPFQAFFVQKPDAETTSVGFEAESRETCIQSERTQSRKARMRKAPAKNGHERQIINLELSDGENADKTRVVYNAETSADYETACDAAKFFSSEAVPQLYTLDAKNTEYSINELPASDVRVGVKIAAKGRYTIAAVRMDVPVVLEDKLTGSVFDLSEEAYSFESEVGSFDNRFVLRLGAGADAIINAEVDAEADVEYYTVGGVKTKASADGVKIKKSGNTVTKVLK